MSTSNSISLEISLLQTGGEVLHAGNVELVCDYRAIHIANTPMDSGRVTVLAKDRISQKWVEYRRNTNWDLAVEVARVVKLMGLPDQPPKVRGSLDTCERWTQLSFRVAVDGQSCAFTIDIQCSGFEGSDAQKLRHLLKMLFAAVGFESYSKSVYGPLY